jgi:hypothetical protein
LSTPLNPLSTIDVGRFRRFEIAALICAWALTAAAITGWLTLTPVGELRHQLTRSQFWFLEAQFALLAAFTWINGPRLFRVLQLRRRDYASCFAAAAFAAVLVTTLPPRTNRIYYDEHIYQGVAQNLTDLRLAQMCNDGTVEYGALQCWRGEYDKHPSGYPYILSLLYRVLGVREVIAFRLNVVVAAMTVIVVFLTTAALAGKSAAAYAGLIAALIPEQLRWSHSAAAEPSAALMNAFAVLTAVTFVKTRSTSALVWCVAAAVFAIQFRPESVLIAPVIGMVLVLYAPGTFAERRWWWCVLLGVALLAPYAGHVIAVGNDQWGASGARLSAAFIKQNVIVNSGFYIADRRFPVVFTVLALCGLAMHRPRRAVLIPGVFFLVFWGVFLFFYAGSYNYGVDVRFSLLSYAPLAMLAGTGAAMIARKFARLRYAVVPLLLFQFCWYAPYIRAIGEESWGARADVAFAHAMSGELPRNSLVLTHNPSMFHLSGQNAAQLSLATTEPGYIQNTLMPRYAGGVYVHWNYWCNASDAMQQSFCDGALTHFHHTLVREYQERTNRYALYRLLPSDDGSGPHTPVSATK